jgi:hypothetical protein
MNLFKEVSLGFWCFCATQLLVPVKLPNSTHCCCTHRPHVPSLLACFPSLLQNRVPFIRLAFYFCEPLVTEHTAAAVVAAAAAVVAVVAAVAADTTLPSLTATNQQQYLAAAWASRQLRRLAP